MLIVVVFIIWAVVGAQEELAVDKLGLDCRMKSSTSSGKVIEVVDFSKIDGYLLD